MNEARIKLAEAMGWKWHQVGMSPEVGVWQRPNGADWFQTTKNNIPFDPADDANDDFAVLKWARVHLTSRQFIKFSENIANLLIGLEKKKPFDALCISLTTEYQIGFYAKAALPLIEE